MSDAKKSMIRSPSYPSMSLRDAVEAVQKIESQYRLSPVDRVIAAKIIGYSSGSGPANKALAALASYGLLERAGKGEARVTERARDILHAESEAQRIMRLREAALAPALFREIRERFEGIDVPPEDGVITFLNRQGFNPTAVRPAAKAFLETVIYLADISASESHGARDTSSAESHPSEGDKDNAPMFGGARVGDLVQWESNGVLMLESPRRVRMVSDDGRWVAVEGSETGMPMDEIVVEKRGKENVPQPPNFPMQPEITPDDLGAKGEIEWMRNRLGAETNIRLLVKGEMGPKEIVKLITILNAQKSVLEDD